YMAPEHFEPSPRRIADAASGDVYALGLTLYELLTLQPAFAAGSTFRLIQDIKSRTPTRPRRLDSDIKPSLERIILTPIEKEQHDRYPSPEALASDLERFVAGERPRGTRVAPHHRVRSWIRRHPNATFSVVGMALAALTAAALAQFFAASESRF